MENDLFSEKDLFSENDLFSEIVFFSERLWHERRDSGLDKSAWLTVSYELEVVVVDADVLGKEESEESLVAFWPFEGAKLKLKFERTFEASDAEMMAGRSVCRKTKRMK